MLLVLRSIACESARRSRGQAGAALSIESDVPDWASLSHTPIPRFHNHLLVERVASLFQRESDLTPVVRFVSDDVTRKAVMCGLKSFHLAAVLDDFFRTAAIASPDSLAAGSGSFCPRPLPSRSLQTFQQIGLETSATSGEHCECAPAARTVRPSSRDVVQAVAGCIRAGRG